ncbi:MAG: hypothetical protein H7232_07050 [Aeromicrobium sp.]|nr:hypothetical protein [Burkholderiales bacterium]
MRKLKRHLYTRGGVTRIFTGKTVPLTASMEYQCVNAVCYVFGISRATLWRMKTRGEFPAFDPIEDTEVASDVPDGAA